MRVTLMYRCGMALLVTLLLACTAQKGSVRTIAVSDINSVPVESRAAGTQAPVIRVNCRANLSKDEDLVKALVEERVREGNYYAALAQIQTLPTEVASVAALRADILRQLQSPQAEPWYRALQGTCMSGRAEHGLGLLAAQREDFNEALKRLIAAAALLPADSRVRNDLGFVFLHVKLDQRAEFELRTAYELAPEEKMPAFNLALLALLRSDESAWSYWSERANLVASDREELVRSCQYLMRKRSNSQSSVACPMSPRLSNASSPTVPIKQHSKTLM